MTETTETAIASSNVKRCEACERDFHAKNDERYCARKLCVAERRKASVVSGNHNHRACAKADRHRVAPGVMRRSPRGRG